MKREKNNLSFIPCWSKVEVVSMLVRTPISHLRASSREDHGTLRHKDDPPALDWIIEATGFL